MSASLPITSYSYAARAAAAASGSSDPFSDMRRFQEIRELKTREQLVISEPERASLPSALTRTRYSHSDGAAAAGRPPMAMDRYKLFENSYEIKNLFLRSRYEIGRLEELSVEIDQFNGEIKQLNSPFNLLPHEEELEILDIKVSLRKKDFEATKDRITELMDKANSIYIEMMKIDPTLQPVTPYTEEIEVDRADYFMRTESTTFKRLQRMIADLGREEDGSTANDYLSLSRRADISRLNLQLGSLSRMNVNV